MYVHCFPLIIWISLPWLEYHGTKMDVTFPILPTIHPVLSWWCSANEYNCVLTLGPYEGDPNNAISSEVFSDWEASQVKMLHVRHWMLMLLHATLNTAPDTPAHCTVQPPVLHFWFTVTKTMFCMIYCYIGIAKHCIWRCRTTRRICSAGSWNIITFRRNRQDRHA